MQNTASHHGHSPTSRSCMLIGAAIGVVVSLVVSALIGALGGWGLFFFLALAIVVGALVARACNRSGGDLWGIGERAGLRQAEREGRLTAASLTEAARVKAVELAERASESETAAVLSRKASEMREKASDLVGDSRGATEAGSDGTPDETPPPAEPVAPATPPTERPAPSEPVAPATPPTERPEPSEPVAPANPPTEVPPSGAATAPIGGEDDLQRIKGIGPQAAALLKELGVTRFDEIAAWSDEDINRLEERMGGVSGRIRRDDWVGQARVFAGKSE